MSADRVNWAARRALVTGATGIVGSWLCDELRSLGAQVIALVLDEDRSSMFFRDGTDSGCAIVRGDLADYATCARAVNSYQVDYVFHLGAQTIVGAALRDPLECFESNVRGTYNLLEAVRRIGGVKAVVVASSDKAYGDADVLPYTEDMALRGSHPYDVSKSCTDLIAQAYARTYGLPITIARCGNIYGPGDLNWSRIVPGAIRSVLTGERLVLRSDGSMVRDYIYVRDVVSAYLAATQVDGNAALRGQAFNFSPEKPFTVRQIVTAIGEAMGVELDPIVANMAAMEIKSQTLDSSKARETLGWGPTWSLAAGLRETITWYKELLEGAPSLHAD